MIQTKLKPVVASMLCVTVLGTSGCSTIKENIQVAYGCTAGAVVGALGGALVGKGDPRYIAGGAVAGILVGCGVGLYLQHREEQLAENAAKHGYTADFVRISNDKKETGASNFSKDAEDDVYASQMSITSDKPMFASGKSTITDKKELENLDSFIKEYIKGMDAQSKIYIVGHTDSTGDAYYNQKLSEKRALFIATRFEINKAPKNQIFFEGVGESQPIASNATEEGKAKNRRFELIDVFNDAISSKAVTLDKVSQVSRAKKQQINNVMNDQGLKVASEQMKAKKDSKEEMNNPVPVPKKPESVPTSIAKTPVKVRDTNSLKLQGVKFDSQESARELTDTIGVYHDDRWSVFSKAYADTGFIDSCAVSEPRVKSTIKTLGNVGTYNNNTSDHLPGMIGNMWFNKIDPNSVSTMVIIGPVTVNKDSFESEGYSDLQFIKNYSRANQKVDYKVGLNVETYRGDDAVLYRVYPKGKSSIQCADIVFSTKGELVTKHAEIVYKSKGNTLSKTMSLKTKL